MAIYQNKLDPSKVGVHCRLSQLPKTNQHDILTGWSKKSSQQFKGHVVMWWQGQRPCGHMERSSKAMWPYGKKFNCHTVTSSFIAAFAKGHHMAICSKATMVHQLPFSSTYIDRCIFYPVLFNLTAHNNLYIDIYIYIYIYIYLSLSIHIYLHTCIDI